MFKRKKIEDNKAVTEISLPTLARWYAYDSGLEDPNEIAAALGMLPTSEEGARLEEDASDVRVDKVLSLLALLECVCDINAQAVAGLQFNNLAEAGHDVDSLEKEREHIEDMYRNVGMSALIAALSAGIELGIIENKAIQGNILNVE